MPTLIKVPLGISFDALQLAFTADGSIQFDFDVIEAICRANNMNPAVFSADQGKVVALVAAWYIRNRLDGGIRRPLVERLVCGADSSIEEFVAF